MQGIGEIEMQGSVNFDGSLVGNITRGGGGDTVVITPVVTSGTKIADVSVGGVEKDLYIPDYGADITEIKQSLSQLKHVPITTDTATFPSTVSIQGDNYYQKVGRLVIVNVNLKIVSSTKRWHRVTNYISNSVDRPIYIILGNASDGDVDGIMQPFDITSQGTLEIYNTKTGTTYCQGSVAYFANNLG